MFLEQIKDQLPVLPEKEDVGVLISIRNPHLMNIPIPLQERVRQDILDIITRLKEKGYKLIRLLCHDHRDIPFAVSFQEVDYIYTSDTYAYLSLLQSCKLNISYRLHATLPCMSFGTPSIKISYDERASSLMKTIGLDNWNINLLDGDNIADKVVERIDNLHSLKRQLKDAKADWNKLHKNMITSLKNFSNDVYKYSQEQ